MNIGTFNSLTLQGYPNTGPKSLTYAVDMSLAVLGTKQYSVDMLLQQNVSKNYSVDMVLQGANSDFYSVDMVLADPNHDNGAWHLNIGNNLTQPIDPNRLGIWSTYSRPSIPVDGQAGINKQTGKLEYWSEKQNRWNTTDGIAA